ncbi:MAG: MurA [Proteobacteria bacterium]|nr:MurA [Pseudomonadota bacterium]
MTTATIIGPTRLNGSLSVQGSKNAAQKMIPATLVFPGIYVIRNLPSIQDTCSQLDVVSFLGGKVTREGTIATIDTRTITSKDIPPEITARSTGTFLFAGALLSRFGFAKVHHPGGCEIGRRPVTWHLDAFRALGATVTTSHDHYEAQSARLNGCEIVFQRPTVNGTVNAILAAARCEGTTILRNTPTEPDIENTVDLLNKAGASISISSGTVEILGRIPSRDAAVDLAVIPDRNDAATFAIAAAMLGGSIQLSPINPDHLDPLLVALSKAGARWSVVGSERGQVLTVSRITQPVSLSLESGPFPAFSTDWGPMFQVLMTQLGAASTFHETVFSDRFKHIPDLVSMGAKIEYFQPTTSSKYQYNFDSPSEPGRGHAIRVFGSSELFGRSVYANDIRAGAALVLAAMAAKGTTQVANYDQIFRGYEDFAQRLNKLGAQISVHDDQKI